MECLHVGTPPSSFSCWETKIVYFHNFLELSDAQGMDNLVTEVHLFPGGCTRSGWVSLFLCNFGSDKIAMTGKL